MFYSYRKFKKTSNKGMYILTFFVLIVVIWSILAYVGVDIKTRTVTKNVEFLDKSIDLSK